MLEEIRPISSKMTRNKTVEWKKICAGVRKEKIIDDNDDNDNNDNRQERRNGIGNGDLP